MSLRTEFKKVKKLVVSKVPEMVAIQLGSCDEAETYHKESLNWDGADKGRQYAHVNHHPNVICFADAGKLLPPRNQQGIIVHEFGHLIADDSDDAHADMAAYWTLGLEIKYDERNLQYIEPILE